MKKRPSAEAPEPPKKKITSFLKRFFEKSSSPEPNSTQTAEPPLEEPPTPSHRDLERTSATPQETTPEPLVQKEETPQERPPQVAADPSIESPTFTLQATPNPLPPTNLPEATIKKPVTPAEVEAKAYQFYLARRDSGFYGTPEGDFLAACEALGYRP